MKRPIIFAVIVALIASLGSAQTKFSFQLGGGMNYSSGGDLARGLRGQSDYLADEYQVSGRYDVPLWGFNFSGEFLYHLNSRFALGLGIGYFEQMKESQISYTYGFVDVIEKVSPKYAVIPITANVHYYLPLGQSLRLDLSAGAGYYLARMNYEYRQDLSLLGYNGNDVYTFQASKGGLGLQGGVGLELILSPRLALALNVLGRYASISGFSGDWTEKGGGDFWDFDESGSGEKFWYYEWNYNSKTYAQLAFQEEIPSGSTVKNARPAKLEVLGFSVLLSIKVGLF